MAERDGRGLHGVEIQLRHRSALQPGHAARPGQHAAETVPSLRTAGRAERHPGRTPRIFPALHHPAFPEADPLPAQPRKLTYPPPY